MKNLGQHFSNLENRRYDITSTCNVTYQGIDFSGVAGSTWELTMNHTYHELLKSISECFTVDETGGDKGTSKLNVQQLRNLKSTLHSYLAFFGKTEDSRVGVEMTSSFDESVASYLREIDVSHRTKRDRRHHLRAIRRHFGTLTANNSIRLPKLTSLSAELRLALAKADIAPKTLAKRCGVSPSAMQRWLAGALPNRRGVPALRRIEAELGLARDTLAGLITTDPLTARQTEQQIEFRMNLGKRCEDRYYLPLSDFSESLKGDWKALFDYKTAVTPTYERSARGVWRMIPKATSEIKCPLVEKGSNVSPTAFITLNFVRAYLGFLMRPVGDGGWGLSSEEAQTLAWLAHPEALSAFLEFRTERSAGLKHRGQKVFCLAVASLIRVETGYLRQREELLNSLPESYRPTPPDSWVTMCDRAHKLLAAWSKVSNGTSRVPEEPLAHLLDLDEPIQPILKAIRDIEQAAAAAFPGSVQQAILKRDALLLALLVSNPLRARTIRSLTVTQSNNGSVYRTSQGWRIRLARAQLKNGEGSAGERYDVAISAWVGKILEEYIEEFRPVIASKDNRYLFPSSRSDKIWADLGKHVFKLTKRYIPACNGISPHGFRHLVATTWLKKFPNCFLQVAELLNDKLETVMSAYAHLKRDGSLQQHNEQLEALRETLR